MNGTNILSARNDVSLAQNVVAEELVTTKELAQMLGVTERTIRDVAKNKGVESTFRTLKTNGGNQSVKVFNEEQATIIKQEIQKHHNLATRRIDTVSTADGTGCFSMNQTAKALKLPYGNIKLYERLRSEGILNADNSPKQEQVNAGHFKVVVKFVNEKIGNKPVTLTTGRGLVYLAKRFNTQIDESVKADA